MNDAPSENERQKPGVEATPLEILTPAPKAKRSRWPFWVTLFALLILGGAILVPFYAKSHTTACLNSCISNLKQIDGAVQQWALENKKVATDVPKVSEVTPYLKGHQLPTCPGGGRYTLHSVSENPTCNIQGHTL